MKPDEGSNHSRRSVLRGAGVLGAFLGASGIASATPGRDPGPKQELLVGVSLSTSNAEQTVRSALIDGGDVVHSNEDLHYVAVELPEETPEQAREQLVETFESTDQIEYVEENATLESFAAPNDPHYGNQHAPQQVNCETAWAETLGDSDVTISIVDQGVQYDHENLAANVDDRIGEVFVGRGSDPAPVSSADTHGTLVSGIAVGETDTGTGHAGISNCSMLAARALDERGQGALSDIADAIQWSADQGVDVINLSLGSAGHLQTLANACEYAVDQGCLVVAAAGNSGGQVAYPAVYDSVVAVSALTATDSLASFSNRGSAIELAAPGSNLLSTTVNDGYSRASGTSMAAPVVSGVAGLVFSAYPGLSGRQVRDHLQATAADLGLSASAQGHGRVDAADAVTTAPDGYDGDGDDGTDDDDRDGDEDDHDADSHLLSFVTDPDARYAGYEFTATGPVEFTEAPTQTPSGGAIEGGTYVAEDYIEADDGTWHAGGVTGGGEGDAFRVEGPITSIDVDQPDAMWVELDGDELSPEEIVDETTDGEGDEGDDGTDDDESDGCGAETNTATVDGELSAGGWLGDSDRWQYAPQTSDPCDATLSLEGPTDADVDLYVTLDGSRPTQWVADESATGAGSDETLTVDLGTAETIRVLVSGTSGSGTYTLTIEERGR